MAGGASEPLRPAQPGLAPLASEAGRPPSGVPPRRRRALRLAASLVLLLSTAGVVIRLVGLERVPGADDQRLCRGEHHTRFL